MERIPLESVLGTSPHLVEHELADGSTVAYHSLLNSPRVLAPTTHALLHAFDPGRDVRSVIAEFGASSREAIDDFVALGFLITPGADERASLRAKQAPFLEDVARGGYFGRLELAITDACNLGCGHCMHFKNAGLENTPSPSLHMSWSVAKRAIDTFVEQAQARGWREIGVHFGNGEPLLNWEVLRKAVEYCDAISEIAFRYGMNTNLIPLTRERAEFLRDHKVSIATSLDGPREANDAIRVRRSGAGTFDLIVSKMRMLQEIGHPVTGFTVTVTPRNFEFIDERILELAADLRVSDVAVDFDLVDDLRLSADACVELVIRLRRRAREMGMRLYGTWETPYRHLVGQSWTSAPYSFCPAMEGRTIEVGIDGRLKTCGHTRTKVGSLESLAAVFSPKSPFTGLVASRVAGADDYCRGCVIEAACGGQCHVTRESVDAPSKMCELLRSVTKALLVEQALEM